MQWGSRGVQKGFHPGGGFFCGCTLEQIIGAQHHQKNIHRPVLLQQAKGIRIAWDLPTVGTGIDHFMTCPLCQQVDPTVFRFIAIPEESSGIVAICIGISETQYPHRNHLR